MDPTSDGNAIVFCQGALKTRHGKVAHGLIRRTSRYSVVAVVDSRFEGQDAGMVLDGRAAGIPVCRNVPLAVEEAKARGVTPTHFVVGLTPRDGRLPGKFRPDLIQAINAGLHVDSGLLEFLSEDREIARLAEKRNVRIRDVGKASAKGKLHSFTGRIREVRSTKVAVLGTDAVVGKRTTAWLLVDALSAAGGRAVLIGTGPTAWMQGARFGLVLDSLPASYAAGELEHTILRAWEIENPQVIVIEGQGGLMHPARPGGCEILAAVRPDLVVLQHAPARREYEGFPDHSIHPLEKHVRAIELMADTRVIAITINHEGLEEAEIPEACRKISQQSGLPAFDVLRDGAEGLAATILRREGCVTA